MDQEDSKEPQEQINGLEESLTMEKEKAQEYLRQLKYLHADFENYRKRTDIRIFLKYILGDL